MNQFILFADIASDLAETARSTAEKFGFDWPHFAAQVINFLIVSGLLVAFAYRPILDVLEERRKRIADGLANAEKIKHELARTEAARQEVLNQANAQANKLIEEARAAAARVGGAQARSGPPGGGNHRQSHRQDSDRRRPAAARGRNQPATGSLMNLKC